MPTRTSSVIQIRVDEKLKQAFADAARRADTTPSRAVRGLMEAFVRKSSHEEAERQSRIVASAPDHEETMDEVARITDWLRDD